MAGPPRSRVKMSCQRTLAMIIACVLVQPAASLFSVEIGCSFTMIGANHAPKFWLWYYMQTSVKPLFYWFDPWRFTDDQLPYEFKDEWTFWHMCSRYQLNWHHYLEGDSSLSDNGPEVCNAECKQPGYDTALCDDVTLLYGNSVSKIDYRVSMDWNFGYSCADVDHLLNCDCASCQTWQAECGCLPKEFENTQPTPWLLHGRSTMPECQPNFFTHLVTPVVCHDKELRFQGGHDSTPPFVCYNSVPQFAHGSIRFSDEDPAQGQVAGLLVFDLANVGTDVAAIDLVWATDSSTISDMMKFNISVFALGSPSYPVWLLATSRPSGATHLVAYLSNPFGRTSAGWRTKLYDLIVPSWPAQKPVSGGAFEMKVGGPDLSTTDSWWWAADTDGLANCSGARIAGTPIDGPTIQGSIASWTQDNTRRLPAGVRHVLCRESGNRIDAMAVVWADAPDVLINLVASESKAGKVLEVIVTGVDLPEESMLMLVPEGTQCEASVGNAVFGELVMQSAGNNEQQKWRILPTRPGDFEICWDSCGGLRAIPGAAPCRSQKRMLTVSPCAACDASKPCFKCFEVNNMTRQQVCTGLPTMASDEVTVFNETPGCGQIDLGLMLPLVATHRADVKVQPKNRRAVNSKEVWQSMDVAGDFSYLVVADAVARSVTFVNLDGDEVVVLAGQGPACPSMPGGCEYLCNTPGNCLQTIDIKTPSGGFAQPCAVCGDGGLAADARFIMPVSVRVAPSGSYVLVVDAGAHRLRRIDAPPTGGISTVAGIGQATYLRNAAYAQVRKDLELEELNLLQGKQCPSGGPCTEDGGLAVRARLNLPWDVAISPAFGQVFLIADRMNNRIRKVAFGIITTVAGCAASTCGDEDGPALQLNLNEPVGIEFLPGDSGAFVFTERSSSKVRYVDGAGVARTLATMHGNLLWPFAPRVTATGKELLVTVHCDEIYDSGKSYVGCQSRTKDGDLCLKWATVDQQLVGNEAPLTGQDWAHNYCRDPYNYGNIWCYVSGETGPEKKNCTTRASVSGSSLFFEPGAGRSIATLALPHASTWDSSVAPPPSAASIRSNVSNISMETTATFELLRVIDVTNSDRSSDVVLTTASAIAGAPDGSVFAVQADGNLFQVHRNSPQCPALSTYDPTSGSCECDPGSLPMMTNGVMECTECPPNKFCNPEDVVDSCQCPLRRTTLKAADVTNGTAYCSAASPPVLKGTTCTDAWGSSVASDCHCPHGSFGKELSASLSCSQVETLPKTCHDCHSSLMCAAGWSLEPGLAGIQNTLRLKNGFWADVADTAAGYRIFECAREDHCAWTPYHTLVAHAALHGCGNEPTKEARIACASQGGAVGSRPWPAKGTVGDATCLGNREGFGCARCSDGYVRKVSRGKEVCRSCKSTQGFFVSAFDYSTKLWILAIFYNFLNNPRGSKFMASYMIATAVGSLADFLQQYFLLSDLELVPRVPLQFDVTLYLPRINIESAPLRCLFGNPREIRYPFEMALPLNIIGMFVVLWIVARLTATLRKKLPSPDSPLLKSMVFLQMPVDMIKNFTLEKNKVLNTLGFLFCAIYISLTKLSLALFMFTKRELPTKEEGHQGSFPAPDGVALSSTDQDNIFTLIRYPDVIFLAPNWSSMLPTGIFALIFITIGWFAFHVKVAIEGPSRFPTDANFRNRHKYFYGKYREDRYWWTLMSFTKAVSLNVVATVGTIPGVPNLRVYCMLFINLAFLSGNHMIRPYKVVLNSSLDTYLHMGVISLLVGAFVRKGFDGSVISPLIVAFATLCIVPLILFFGGMVWRIITGKRRQQQQDDFVVQSVYVTKAFTHRITNLKSTTLLKVMKTFSGPERVSILSGLDFLNFAMKNETVLRAIARKRERGSRARSTIRNTEIVSNFSSRSSLGDKERSSGKKSITGRVKSMILKNRFSQEIMDEEDLVDRTRSSMSWSSESDATFEEAGQRLSASRGHSKEKGNVSPTESMVSDASSFEAEAEVRRSSARNSNLSAAARAEGAPVRTLFGKESGEAAPRDSLAETQVVPRTLFGDVAATTSPKTGENPRIVDV